MRISYSAKRFWTKNKICSSWLCDTLPLKIFIPENTSLEFPVLWTKKRTIEKSIFWNNRLKLARYEPLTTHIVAKQTDKKRDKRTREKVLQIYFGSKERKKGDNSKTNSEICLPQKWDLLTKLRQKRNPHFHNLSSPRNNTRDGYICLTSWLNLNVSKKSSVLFCPVVFFTLWEQVGFPEAIFSICSFHGNFSL